MQNEKRPTDDPDVKPFPKNMPVVFMFQPTHYKVVPGDKLQEWERTLREKVGIKGLKADPEAMKMMAGTATDSISYGEWGWDDCDSI